MSSAKMSMPATGSERDAALMCRARRICGTYAHMSSGVFQSRWRTVSVDTPSTSTGSRATDVALATRCSGLGIGPPWRPTKLVAWIFVRIVRYAPSLSTPFR